jgi:hypothetical protein
MAELTNEFTWSTPPQGVLGGLVHLAPDGAARGGVVEPLV